MGAAVVLAADDNRKSIRVVLDKNYPPYSFESAEGRLQGILIDQWRAWEKKTGIKTELHGLEWAEAVQRMRAGDFDVIASIVETAARREYLDFSAAFTTMEVPIYFRKEISGIVDLESLRGFPVAVKNGDQHIDLLTANGVAHLIPFPNHPAIVAAAKERKIAVFMFDEPSALYHLNKAGIAGEFRHSAPVFRDELKRAVRKGDAATMRLVTEGFAAIEPAEFAKIDEKWFGRAIDRGHRYLVYAGYAGVAVLILVAGLIGWNRMLTSRIDDRTAALRESEERFRQIAEHVEYVFWLTTADFTQTLYISPAFEKIWGLTRQRLVADQQAFFAAIHPEDRPRVSEVMAQNPERGFQLEYRVTAPDGAVRWVCDRGFPIMDATGRVFRIARIIEDVTERKRAAEAVKRTESRIRLLIDTIPTSAWSLQADGRVDFLNRRLLEYTGRSLEEELAEPNWPIHPDDRAAVLEKWTADMAAGRPFESEMRLRRADGAHRWFLVRTVPFRDEQGTIVKWYGASIDIEDRKQAEELLRSQKQQLRALIKRLHAAREDEAKRIARELHDDLGQQLTALNLQLDHLEMKLSDATPGAQAQVTAMHALVNHTVELVQTIASGLRLGQLDVLGLTAAIDWQLQEFSRRSGIPCEVTRLDEIANLSDTQNTAVYRILQEALTNIARHAAATRVSFSLRREKERLTLRIEDNGRGITAAELNDRRAIGLLGMRERADIVGGTVTISGAPGKGTTVLVTIPLKSAAPIPT